jgi:hypothetical protein
MFCSSMTHRLVRSVGAVVGVGDDLVVVELLRCGVEGGVQFVVGLVLPIAWPGRSVAGAVDIHGIGKGERGLLRTVDAEAGINRFDSRKNGANKYCKGGTADGYKELMDGDRCRSRLRNT